MKSTLIRLSAFVPVFMLLLGLVAAAPPPQLQPNVTIELVNSLPDTINLGESYTVEIHVTSEMEFLSVTAMPAPEFPGKYVVFNGPDRAGRSTSATLYLTLTGKDTTTADFTDGVPVSFVVGARFKGGVTVVKYYNFSVVVP